MSEGPRIYIPGQKETPANRGDVSVSRSESAPTDLAIQQRPFFQVHVVNEHSLFVGIKDLMPEDILWRREHPNVPAMICLKEDNACGCNWDCMMKLALRAGFFFKRFPNTVQLFMMFQRTQETPLERAALRVGQLSQQEQKILGRHNRHASQRRTKLPRVWALHITKNFAIRAFRANYDALQYLLKDAARHEVVQPRIW